MFTKRTVLSIALLFAVMAGTTLNCQESSALGGFLNKLKGKTTDEAASGTDASAKKKPTSSEPIVYENAMYKYKITYPGDWELKDDDPKKSIVTLTDSWGEMGNVSINSTWMSDDFPVDAAVKALVDKAEQRKKHGEVTEYYTKNVTAKGGDPKKPTLVKGVVITESDIDPDMKRLQWEAYGAGNYYNFTWSTNVEKFPKYKERFQKMLDSLEFDFTKK